MDNPADVRTQGGILKAAGLVLPLAVALLAGSCSDLKNSLPVTPAPNSVQVHESGWNDPSAANFHGRVLKAEADSWDVSTCVTCHGTTTAGGTHGPTCYGCHAPFPHVYQFPLPARHVGYMLNNAFPFEQCQPCHGTSFTGGSVVDVSCEGSHCHADANGNPKPPQACNTCHGDFRGAAADLVSYAPPRDVNGDTLETARGVGAHQPHLAEGDLGRLVKCQECHTVPSQFSPGHITPGYRATVAFNDTLARTVSGDGTSRPSPSYDPATLKCSNVYCHGNWRVRKATSPSYPGIGQNMYADSVMTANRASPMWTGGGDEAACGTCHDLPPAGHVPVPVTGCYSCHFDVGPDGTIIDPSKHIDGKIEYMNFSRPMQ